MSQKRFLSFFLFAAAFIQGCATHGVDNADRNQFVTEFYAFVTDIEKVKYQSHVGPAVTIGAIGGALENSDGDRSDIVGGAIVGGMITGVLAALFEGSNDGYEYQLDAIDGDRIRVMLDYYPAELGDCVIVRVSGSVEISKQPLTSCDRDSVYVE